jgi:hypothetical protein
VRAAKWFTLAATYVMNTWSSRAAGSAAGVVLHSVPPLLAFVAAEAVTDLRDKLTDAVTAAVRAAQARTANGGPLVGDPTGVHGVGGPLARQLRVGRRGRSSNTGSWRVKPGHLLCRSPRCGCVKSPGAPAPPGPLQGVRLAAAQGLPAHFVTLYVTVACL